MSENINFNIHEVYEEEELDSAQVINYLINTSFDISPDNPIGTFFSILMSQEDLTIFSYPNFFSEDSLSNEKSDTTLNISSQKYNTVTTYITDCSICLEKFKDDVMVSVLDKCNHVFHTSCIMEAGQYKAECPLCRNIIPILK